MRFHRETEAELQENKVLALKTIEPVEEDNLEIKINDYFPPDLNFPVRPLWDYSLTRDELDAREHRYFLVNFFFLANFVVGCGWLNMTVTFYSYVYLIFMSMKTH